MYTLRLLSGKRSKTFHRLSFLHLDELFNFAVINSKNVSNDRGDFTPNRSKKYVPYDQRIVAECEVSDFSVKSLLQNGFYPQVSSPTGSFDKLQTSLAADRYFSTIDESQLKIDQNEQS